MFRERSFRFNVLPIGGFFVVVVLATTMGFNRTLHTAIFDAVTWGMLVGLWAFTLLLWVIFPVYAGSAGLRATDGIGRFHQVRWEEMRSVRSIFGFYWIQQGKVGKALCFPRFLSRRQEFRDFVLAHAPEGNALREYLLR